MLLLNPLVLAYSVMMLFSALFLVHLCFKLTPFYMYIKERNSLWQELTVIYTDWNNPIRGLCCGAHATIDEMLHADERRCVDERLAEITLRRPTRLIEFLIRRNPSVLVTFKNCQKWLVTLTGSSLSVLINTAQLPRNASLISSRFAPSALTISTPSADSAVALSDVGLRVMPRTENWRLLLAMRDRTTLLPCRPVAPYTVTSLVFDIISCLNREMKGVLL